MGLLNALKALFIRKQPPPGADAEVADPPFDEAVVLPIEEKIDLHPFAPRDIPSVVQEYLEQCLERGFREVRIIHGRGRGVQRRIVRSILDKHPHVVDFNDAAPEVGGWGATVVRLTAGAGGRREKTSSR